MEANTKVPPSTAWNTAMANCSTKMEHITKDNSEMTWWTAVAFSTTHRIAWHMMDNGLMTSSTASESSSTSHQHLYHLISTIAISTRSRIFGQNTRASSNWTISAEMANCIYLMGRPLKVSSVRIAYVGMDSIVVWEGKLCMVGGRATFWWKYNDMHID